MRKQSKNLSLDPEAVRRGERYSELHEPDVSQLVSNFRSSLPVDDDAGPASLSPAVKRLLGAGVAGGDRRYLREKHSV